MMEFSQMLLNLVIAMALGALLGLEREIVGKEAGIRTAMMVSAGAAMFTMVGLNLPYIVAQGNVGAILADNAGYMTIIANIVVGAGFLGAGSIIKTDDRAHGLTTAAVIWTSASLGVLAGLGMTRFAAGSALLLTALLYALRSAGLAGPHKTKRK